MTRQVYSGSVKLVTRQLNGSRISFTLGIRQRRTANIETLAQSTCRLYSLYTVWHVMYRRVKMFSCNKRADFCTTFFEQCWLLIYGSGVDTFLFAVNCSVAMSVICATLCMYTVAEKVTPHCLMSNIYSAPIDLACRSEYASLSTLFSLIRRHFWATLYVHFTIRLLNVQFLLLQFAVLQHESLRIQFDAKIPPAIVVTVLSKKVKRQSEKVH